MEGQNGGWVGGWVNEGTERWVGGWVGGVFTWYSMEGSLRLLRQMAQVSAQMSQLHMVTAFHFLISNRGAGEGGWVGGWVG